MTTESYVTGVLDLYLKMKFPLDFILGKQHNWRVTGMFLGIKNEIHMPGTFLGHKNEIPFGRVSGGNENEISLK